MSSLPLQEYAEFAVEAAKAAAEITLRYYQKLPGIEYKADRSPVTIADRESEKLLRARIEERYPSHGILGEEFGSARPEAELRWLLDPIDGTQSFVRGVPLFGVMLALATGDDALMGVVHMPALGETAVAWRGGGCWWNGTRAHVSTVNRLEDALLLGTDPLGLSAKHAGYERLRARVKMERGWGDCYGYVLVATGRADIMTDPRLSEWDAAPLVPIIEEAGGRFTDWQGKRTISGGDGFATNGALFDEVLKTLSSER
jgi:histidinol-phosphatase